MNKILISLFLFSISATKAYSISITWTATNCTAHGCSDGTIIFYVTNNNTSECGVAHNNPNYLPYPGYYYSASSITYGPINGLSPGTHTFYFSELCQPFLGYDQFNIPVYGYNLSSYSYTINITEPPCNNTVTIDSVIDTYMNCQSGAIIYTDQLQQCGGYFGHGKATLYKNGQYFTSSQFWPSQYPPCNTTLGPNQRYFGNLDTGDYHIVVENYPSTYWNWNACGSISTQTVHISKLPCGSFHLSLDSVFNNTSYCTNGRVYFKGDGAVSCPQTCGSSPFFFYQLYKDGALYASTTATYNGIQKYFSNLGSGNYFIRGWNGTCEDTLFFQIIPTPCLGSSAFTINQVTNSTTPSQCGNGTINFTLSDELNCNGQNGYLYHIYKNATPPIYQTGGNVVTGTQIIKSGFGAGDYYIIIQSDFCNDTSNLIHIEAPPCGQITIDSVKYPCSYSSNNGKIYASFGANLCGSSFSRNYYLYLDNAIISSGVLSDNASQITFSGLMPGTYIVKQMNVFNSSCNLSSNVIQLTSLPLEASISSNISTCQNSSMEQLTISGNNGQPPYSFTYKINGGSNQTITTGATSSSVALPISTSNAGTFVYKLVSVSDANCSHTINDSSIVSIRTLPTASISSGTFSICQYATPPSITLTASGGTPPYTFTYKINDGSNLSESTSGNSVTLLFPTSNAGAYTYSLLSIADAYCTKTLSASATYTVNPVTIPTAYPALRCVGNENIPITLTATVPPNSIGSGTFNIPNPYTGPNTNYSYTYTNNYGCPYTSNSYVGNYSSCITITYTPRQICIKALIEGYYIGELNMATTFFNQGVSTNLNVTDSIEICLRNTVSPYSLIASTKTIINKNGTACWQINSLFPITGYYYVVIKHRNGIETWSSVPVYISATPAFYDFTTSASQAYGNNMKQVEPGVWAFYNGDLNHDENIDLLDVAELENDINTFQFGYNATDLNGDGNVDLLDSPIMESNVNSFIFSNHP